MSLTRTEEIAERKQRNVYNRWFDNYNSTFEGKFDFTTVAFDNRNSFGQASEIVENELTLTIEEIEFQNTAFLLAAVDFFKTGEIQVVFPTTELVNPSIRTADIDGFKANLKTLLEFNEEMLMVSDRDSENSISIAIGRRTYDNEKGETLPCSYAMTIKGIRLIEFVVKEIKTATNTR